MHYIDVATRGGKALKHFTHFVDIFGPDIQATNPTKYAQILGKMSYYIDSFEEAFDQGKWELWNGNNWTPVLSMGAMHWCIAMWHDEPARAGRIIKIINDISLLHIPMTTVNGGYKEGVCQYSYMSIDATLTIARLYAAAFGEVWPGADYARLEASAKWHIDSYDTTASAVDFGDSHACSGMVPTTIRAALASVIAAPNPQAAAVAAAAMPGGSGGGMDACMLRQWSSAAYYLNAYDPWNYPPALAIPKYNIGSAEAAATTWNDLAAECDPGPKPGTEPLGPAVSTVYPVFGYGKIMLPLLTTCTSDSDVEMWQCSADDDPNVDKRPRLKMLGMYSMLALQGRPNAYPHSEVDYATFKWSTFGVTLLGELGYGKIATSTGPFDLRRYVTVDNSPAGHNTVIVREANQMIDVDGTDVEINYSQLTHQDGTTSLDQGDGTGTASNGGNGDGGGSSPTDCVLLDGSNVYGASYTNGWFEYMHRWACPFEGAGGHFMMVDAFAVKRVRTAPLAKYGSLYADGFDFLEDDQHDLNKLTVDEYFHVPTWLNGKDLTSMSEADKVFPAQEDRETFCTDDDASTPCVKNCKHVEASVVAGTDDTVVELESKCGMGHSNWHVPGQAVGRMHGWSMRGGKFVYDGLTTSQAQWGASTLHQNRIRYVANNKTTAAGDMRAFVLTSVRKPATPPPTWVQACAGDGGVGTKPWCVSACVGTVQMDVSLATNGGDGTEGNPQKMMMTRVVASEPCDGANPPAPLTECEAECSDSVGGPRQRGFRWAIPAV